MTAPPLAPCPSTAVAATPPSRPSTELLRRIDGPGPRYTSYPTADRFDGRIGAADVQAALDRRRRLADAGDDGTALSLYVHIPFCDSVCYYCACNKVVTRQHSKAAYYLDALELEAALVIDRLGAARTVSQLHLGGGSPTFLHDEEITRLVATLRRFFHLDRGAEVSIEVDPRTVTPHRLDHLRALGFNRLSFGVQDFDRDVQDAVHRVQPFDEVRSLIAHARRAGFESINVDLIYGLPRQTPASVDRTMAQVVSLRPDRIALYAYAHLPQRFKPQRRIAAADLPDAPQRVEMLGRAMQALLDQGYDHIGMDHFALPADALARAKREGRLQRNFQGYSTQPDCDLIGLGVSSIGRIGDVYYQNARKLEAYYAALADNELPVERGWRLDADDRARRDVIMALMCHGRVDYAEIERRHGLRMEEAFAPELGQLAALAGDGTLRVEPRAIEVTAAGWYVVRTVAMVFDRHLRERGGHHRFSRVV